MALVFDGSDGTIGPPVDGGREVVEAGVRIPEPGAPALVSCSSWLVSSVDSPELVLGDVGELVGLQPELAIPGVRGLDERDIGLEHL